MQAVAAGRLAVRRSSQARRLQRQRIRFRSGPRHSDQLHSGLNRHSTRCQLAPSRDNRPLRLRDRHRGPVR